MKTQHTYHLMAALLSVVFTLPLYAQTSAFTYQGSLSDNGSPASGLYDLRFAIYDAASAGGTVGSPVDTDDVGVTNGLFTVEDNGVASQ